MTTMTERDYLTEVRDDVGKYLDSHDSVVSAEAATELIRRWEGSGLLEGWLALRAHSVLADYISHVSRSRGACRTREARRARFSQFSGEFTEALENEGVEAAREKAGEYYFFHEVTDKEGNKVRKILGDLNARQVLQVRDGYRRRAEDNELKAKVMEAVQKRVEAAGEGATVGSVYTPDQIQKMFERGQK